MSLVEVLNVTKEYANGEESIRPLDGVSLTVEEGDFVSLMGASGSGKSTLLNLIAGIDLVTSGEIVVADTDITKLSRGKLADWRARHIGYIFQTHNLPGANGLRKRGATTVAATHVGGRTAETSRDRDGSGRPHFASDALPSPNVGRAGAAGWHRAGYCVEPDARRR